MGVGNSIGQAIVPAVDKLVETRYESARERAARLRRAARYLVSGDRECPDREVPEGAGRRRGRRRRGFGDSRCRNGGQPCDQCSRCRVDCGASRRDGSVDRCRLRARGGRDRRAPSVGDRRPWDGKWRGRGNRRRCRTGRCEGWGEGREGDSYVADHSAQSSAGRTDRRQVGSQARRRSPGTLGPIRSGRGDRRRRKRSTRTRGRRPSKGLLRRWTFVSPERPPTGPSTGRCRGHRSVGSALLAKSSVVTLGIQDPPVSHPTSKRVRGRGPSCKVPLAGISWHLPRCRLQANLSS